MAALDSPFISVRVVNVDWYLSEESKLPVVRIFGSTPAGQRSCLHLHGALPYFMVRPMEEESSAICAQFEDPGSLNALLPQLEQALESAMASSSGGPGAPSLSPAGGAGRGGRPWGRNRQPVLARLEVVRGVPFYGYHGEEKLFVKVYVNNPALTGKVASVLQAGHVLSTRFQPFESHVPFLLQVFIDYNISGMSYVHLRNALFLQPLPELSSVTSSSQEPSPDSTGLNDNGESPLTGIFTSATVPESLVANPVGQGDAWRSPAGVPGSERAGGRTADGAARTAPARGLEPVTLRGDTDEAAQDLLAGISMSQLFSQPSIAPTVARSRPPKEGPAPRATATSSPGKTRAGQERATGDRPRPKWWERQTTTELEVVGIIDDVINPSLLAAGRAGAADGKPMAVASLRELWDEEKERSRVAGGGSQLSAPPGLELADSQDVWEPPELLLTQHVRDEAEGLARNVLRRATPSRDSGIFPKEESSGPRSQASASGNDFDKRSGEVKLTPSRDGFLSQASGTGEANAAAPVADASCSPANHLPSLGGICDHDVDQGLLDMIAALRGSQQSQSQGVDRESLSSPPAGQQYTRSPSGPLSQRPAFTPESPADQAEAVAATQKKQELDEEELGSRIALAAQAERHYDSDGSDDYLEPARAAAVNVSISSATGNPSAAVPVPGAAGMQTPVLADPPPWSSSQRAASYPPWSQRSAGPEPVRASTLPFWSQRSTEVASAGISGRLAGRDRHGGGKMDGNRLEQGDEEIDEEDEGAEDGVERMLSQLSARSLDDVKDSVQAEIDRERRAPIDPRMSPYDPLLTSRAQGAEPRSQSELVDIICSQVEVEQDQNAQSSTVLADHSMDAIMEEEEVEEDEEDGGGECAMRTEPPRNRGDVDHRWTRGPTQLRYDDEVEGNQEGTERGRVDMEEEEEEEGEEEEDGVKDSGTKGPLRLRGGVGLARTKPYRARPSRAATAPEPSSSSASLPGASSSSPRNGPDMRSDDPPAGSKRAAPASGALPKRRAPLRVPVGIRRSSSMPGVVGGFKPPRLLSTAANLPTVDEAGSAGRCGGGGGGSSGISSDDNMCGGDNGDKSPGFVHREPRKENPATAGGTDSADGDGSSDTQEEDSNKDERSQVVVPGWGSQGHHPVEYSESRLSFVPIAQLRVSPKSTRGMGARTDNDVSETESVEAARKKQKVLGNEGYNRSDGTESAAARVSEAPVLKHGGGDIGGEPDSAKGKPRTASPPPPPENPTQKEKPPLYVGTSGETTPTPALGPPRSEATGGQPGQNTDNARTSPEGRSSAGDSGVDGRWLGADARLRLAQTRGTRSPSSHQARTDNSNGGRRGSTENAAARGSELSPCSPLAPLALQREPGASSENDADQSHVGTNHARGSARSSTPRESRTQEQDPPGTPLCRLGLANRHIAADGVLGAPETAPRCDNSTGFSCSPPVAVASVFPTPTPPPPPLAVYTAGRSPTTPLSAPSDNSDVPPLGQPNPGLPITAARGAGAAASDTPLSDAWSSGVQRTGCNNSGAEESPTPNPGEAFFLTSGSGSAASPARERFSGFTPPTPRQRGVGGRESGTVVLRPPETAPDPNMCAAALSRLGVPQVLHTEPYYSRKDDVPERPREFAGNVFRIQHKDNLQAFDTLQTRELLHAHQQAEAATATPTSPRHRRAGRSVASSCSSYTPRSHVPDSEPRNRAVGGGSGLAAEGGLAMSPSPDHRVTGTGGFSGESYEGGGGSSRALSWTGGDAGQQEPIALRGIDEWKEAAAMFGGPARRQSPHVNQGPGRTVELVPSISPPPCKAVAAWGRANPSSTRSARVVDDLDKPVLRSTRNALGVLAGGGEADLAGDDGSGDMSMVADPNTGQLVPVPVPAACPPPPPTTTTRAAAAPRPPPGPREGGSGDARRLKSPVSSTPEALSTNTPPLRTPESVPSGDAVEPRRSDHITPESRVRPAKQSTQGPHRPTTKSQISPATLTPSSCLSEEEEGGRFAFGLGAAAAAAGRGPAPAAAAAAATAEAASPAVGSQASAIGLSGGILGRGRTGDEPVAAGRGDRLTVLSLELHVQVPASRRPDPRRDCVHAVCWRVKDAFTSAERETVETRSGVIVLPLAARGVAVTSAAAGSGGGDRNGGDSAEGSRKEETCLKCGERRDDVNRAFCCYEGGGFLGQEIASGGGTEAETGRVTFRHGLGRDVEVLEVCSEEQVFRALVGVFCRHDPDFVVGWEVQGDSLGYVVERGLNMEPSMDMTRLLSRTPGRDADKRNARDEWGKTHGSGIWLTGRTVLNMWRLMRSELKLCSYTLQSVAEHVLRKRIPSFSLQLRSRWFAGRNVAARSRALADPLGRATACLSIMDKLDLLGRTSEMARLFGIDFFSVLSRGSQYRVEAVMLRVLKPHNFVAVSPSRQQVAGQAAMESIPLVFEPRSRFYTSPVVVLDFQSLYPSMMIAYNLCYTTILGKFDPKTGGTSGNLGALPYPESNTSAALETAAEAHQAWGKRDGRSNDHHQQQQQQQQRRRRRNSRRSPLATGRGGSQQPPLSCLSPVDEEETPTGAAGVAARSPASSATHPTMETPTGPAAAAEPGSSPQTEDDAKHGDTQGSTPSDDHGGEGFPPRWRGKEGMPGWDPRCIHLAPNTAGFCHPSLRQGILPLMLREILETRVMIKGAMRRAEGAGQRVLARTLNARQFALKMISNVTYGYTAAGFSGRMPMAELADAIVESGRQTLIAAARTVDNHKTWQASVVYGDTDSLFIELKGRSLEEAHRIGKEMATTVSKSCPPDVVLKFEKVYLPCILASKKRYVGHMYESPKDLRPSFDAKGIETVRRDGCPLLVKMLEKVLRLLFTTKDLSQVKGYLYRQWTRILTDRAAVGDFIFAKEVRLGTYASDVYMPPSAIVASKAMANDPRAEPKYCERVPYVVVAGPVGARLMDLVVSPEQFLAEGSGLRLNGKYYITKVINPALDRALALLGVDVNAWYNDMPRPAPRVSHKAKKPPDAFGGGGKGKGKASVITNFFISDRCSLCGEQCTRSVCGKCARDPAANCAAFSRLRESDLAALQLLEVCRQCTGHPSPELFGNDSCGSLECPVFFERHRALLKGQDARELCEALGLLAD